MRIPKSPNDTVQVVMSDRFAAEFQDWLEARYGAHLIPVPLVETPDLPTYMPQPDPAPVPQGGRGKHRRRR